MKTKIAIILLLLLFLNGCAEGTPPSTIKTFVELNTEICTENEKPVIRVYSTSVCPYCKWIKNAVDQTIKHYEEQGKITAYHWELDTKNNTLTPQQENNVPEEELQIMHAYAPNGEVPAFIFGCKYFRLGVGYYGHKNAIEKEIAEFKAVIEKLIEENQK
jgi:thioredoxin-related protein